MCTIFLCMVFSVNNLFNKYLIKISGAYLEYRNFSCECVTFDTRLDDDRTIVEIYMK